MLEEKIRRFIDQNYWARPVSRFGCFRTFIVNKIRTKEVRSWNKLFTSFDRRVNHI